MTTQLLNSWNRDRPPSFALTPDGVLVIVNGLNYPQRWNGLTTFTQNAGMTAPATTMTISTGGTGGTISGLYAAAYLYEDEDGNQSNLSPLQTFTAVSATTFSFSGIDAPTETNRVVLVKVYVSTAGQSTTLYLVRSMTAGQTTCSSTSTDSLLIASDSLPILNDDGSLHAYRHGVPPSNKAVVVHHLDRAFYAVDASYGVGNIEMTSGSTTVTGIGTNWTQQFVNRRLYSPLLTESHTISRYVNTASIRVSTSPAISGKFVPYVILPPPSERDTIYYSEPNEPESVPAVNSIRLQEDGEELVGMFSLLSFLFLAKRNRLYRLSFTEDPAVDGAIFPAASRGMESHRCYARAGDVVYVLDREGVYLFDGGNVQSVSSEIQGYFRDGKINWHASPWFHACNYPSEETVRFFVALEGNYLPKHALAYNYRWNSWWVESYPEVAGSSFLTDIHGKDSLIVGSQNETFYQLQSDSPLDISQPGAGPVVAVSTASHCGLSPLEIGIGSPVVIVEGRGKGQVRRVSGVTGSTAIMDRAWSILPDDTSKYVLGGIPWSYKTPILELPESDRHSKREVTVGYKPTKTAGIINVSYYANHSSDPLLSPVTDFQYGVRMHLGQAEIELLTTDTVGQKSARFSDNSADRLPADKYVSVRLTGAQGKDQVSLNRVRIEGAV